ncbi:MAG: YciI family protein [Actinomycetota bacterium]|nr:YciI family protein [Actinomycetota bacterium]
MNRSHFVYKLIPPRATFAADMTEAEQAVMGEHAAYWTNLFQEGSVVLFGVVMAPVGAWGLAVVEAEHEDDVRAIASDDPAVRTNLCTFDIGVMPSAVVRPRQTAA